MILSMCIRSGEWDTTLERDEMAEAKCLRFFGLEEDRGSARRRFRLSQDGEGDADAP